MSTRWTTSSCVFLMGPIMFYHQLRSNMTSLWVSLTNRTMHAYHPTRDQVAHCFLLTTCLRWSSLSAATIGSSFFRWYEIRWLMLSNNMSLVRTCREDSKMRCPYHIRHIHTSLSRLPYWIMDIQLPASNIPSFTSYKTDMNFDG